MKIDGTTFGSITIDGKTYDHDVIVRLSEKVEKRKKKLSKRIYGTRIRSRRTRRSLSSRRVASS
jgi:hypothetical protein